MSTNKKIGLVVACIAIAGISFYAGTKYPSSRGGAMMMQGNFPDRGSFGGTTGGQHGGRTIGGMMGGFTTGEIISKDDKSITIKLPAGGSKIIFLGATTKVSRSVDGAVSDLTTGTTVSVTGSTNQDGSVTAESVQIRPTTPPSSQTSTGQ